MLAERKKKQFLVRNLVLEPTYKPSAALVSGLAKALREFAAFNGCEEIVVEKAEPVAMRRLLRDALK